MVGERKQGDVLSRYRSLGRAKEFRRSTKESWEENCSNLAPITSRLSWRAADTESSLPMGHHRRQASDTLAPGRATRMVHLVTGSVQMISDF